MRCTAKTTISPLVFHPLTQDSWIKSDKCGNLEIWYPALSCPPQDGLPGHAEQVCNVIWLERFFVARNPACNAEQFRARGQFVVDVQVRRYRCRIFHELFYLPCLRGRITIPDNLLHCRQTVFVPALIGHGIIRRRGNSVDFRNHSLVYPALTSGQILTQGPFCSYIPKPSPLNVFPEGHFQRSAPSE
jgi:hypothetical protein